MGKKKKIKSPVGKRLREIRTLRGISQKTLGIRAGIDQFTASARINQYEREKHIPDYSTASRLAKVLDIPVTYLFTDDDSLAEIILLYSQASKKAQIQVKRLLKN